MVQVIYVVAADDDRADPRWPHEKCHYIFVQKANSFSSRITVSREENRINAKSLLGLLSLELEQGTSITIAAEGADAAAALAALADIMEGRF